MNQALSTYRMLERIALRYNAVYLETSASETDNKVSRVDVLAFVSCLKEFGYCVAEDLLHALYAASKDQLNEVTHIIQEVYGVRLNWAPLVKGWNVPTGESLADHLIAFFANVFGGENSGLKGTTLQCGHFIPDNTFPLQRYNGCPCCGKPFTTAEGVYTGQCSNMKELRLFAKEDLQRLFRSLLESCTPLDATQQEDLKVLLQVFELPADCNITMKETAMHVISHLVLMGRVTEAEMLIHTPADILRYLWFEKTGNAQVVEPKIILAKTFKNDYNYYGMVYDRSFIEEEKAKLKLKYDRKTCRMVATWLNNLSMPALQAVEIMHPKRGMWVRVIRACRLGEYSHKAEFEKLAEIMDLFYRQDYTTLSGKIDIARSIDDRITVLSLLQSNPGVFARSLFSTMLRYGRLSVMPAFEKVADKLPARLLVSLANNADYYFDAEAVRVARTITGMQYNLPANPMVVAYSEEELKAMVKAVNDSYLQSVCRRFAAIPTDSKSIYIDPQLFNIPLSVGERNTTVQDAACALQGTKFKLQGDHVRLFMQWGKDLPAQHLDMDLSAAILYADGHREDCAYFSLVVPGAKHSGDIQHIPDQVGTAEYIELDVPELQKIGAKYVAFTCNAYTGGELSTNMVVGWMDSAHPMTISEETGVAYDPSCVQHMVRIRESLTKGLLFGVLDVENKEVIWMEIEFSGRTVTSLSFDGVKGLLKKIANKLSIGDLLKIKAKAQHLQLVDDPELANEVYTYQWALNPAEVSRLIDLPTL